jgi:cell division protein FtsA
MNQIVAISPRIGKTSETKAKRKSGARSGPYGVLDIGDSKIVCLIGKDDKNGSTKVLGMGWQKSRGVKAGNIVNLDDAEMAIRAAVGEAEVMADMQIKKIVVNLSCGQPSGHLFSAELKIDGRQVTTQDIMFLANSARYQSSKDGRDAVHTFPLGFDADASKSVSDPRGIICDKLSAKFHVIDAAYSPLRNLGSCLLRCDLEPEDLVFSPFASGLSALTESERQIGALVIDMGSGTTSLAGFYENKMIFGAQVPIGGAHVTNDISRVLSTSTAHAEWMKTLHGSALPTRNDTKDFLPLSQLDDEGNTENNVSRAILVDIIQARLEETFELVRDKIREANLFPMFCKRVILTGGACQLLGAREVAERIFKVPTIIRRPGVLRNLPPQASTPAFATALGLMAWASGEGHPSIDLSPSGERRNQGLFPKVVGWLRQHA